MRCVIFQGQETIQEENHEGKRDTEWKRGQKLDKREACIHRPIVLLNTYSKIENFFLGMKNVEKLLCQPLIIFKYQREIARFGY